MEKNPSYIYEDSIFAQFKGFRFFSKSSVNVLNKIKCSGNVPEMLSATVASRWMKFQLNVMCPGYFVYLEVDDHSHWTY